MPRQVGAPSVGDRIVRLLAGTPVRDRRRFIGPVVAAVGAAVLIWLAMPHAPWYVKLPLALLALGYIGAQSAAYLGHGDEAEPGASPPDAGDSSSSLRRGS
ncbi:MAG: hypothetical protein E6J01_10470 [Chloroflexi bacterium]|nr:MAG: hypothetical protein E6J01_10470 [Chloroflexota bacterium]